MSAKKRGDIIARRLQDSVELFVSSSSFDEYGQIVRQLVSLGQRPADVKEMGGRRLAYYQNLAYQHPLTITIRSPTESFDAIAYNGKMLNIISSVIDPDNREYTKIEADYKDVEVQG